jgi:general secretion pathway protein M
MKALLIQFWRARAPRERLVLGGGAALLVLALGYAYGWLPMQRDAAQMRKELPQLRVQARQLQQDAAEVVRLRAQTVVARTVDSLTSIVEQRAVAGGLRERIESITALDTRHVRVVLPQVAFDAWVAWLGELQANDGIRVESARIEAGDTAGVIKVEAVLAGAG